ncbi:3'-5' exonuclease [bacterium]|nr:3'-5' exonuclease [bacterium]
MSNIVVFDLETNGFSRSSSVLSVSAIKATINKTSKKIEKKGVFNRFYYIKPDETENIGALNVNGLYSNVITDMRGENCEYPKYFLDDIKSFESFCKDANIFVGHNVEFDISFIPFKMDKQFCTMKNNIEILKLKAIGKKNYKWPTLEECATFYNVDFDKNSFHNSLYDVEITLDVLERMLNHKEASVTLLKLLDSEKKQPKSLFD